MKFPRPEAFDILGIGIFSFFILVSSRAIFLDQPLPEWMAYALLVIGIFGLLIDGYIVYKAYLKK